MGLYLADRRRQADPRPITSPAIRSRCSTQQFVNETYIDMLKKGSVLKLIAKNRKNEDLVVTINLGGVHRGL